MGKANESIFSGKPQPVSWCTECGAGLTKDNYCVECLNQTIADQRRVIDTLTKAFRVHEEIIMHYKLGKPHIRSQRVFKSLEEARKLLGDSNG